MAVQFAVLKPGDTVMGMNLDHGGHLTHGSPVNFSGTYFHIVPYGVNDEGFIDYDKVMEIALECKPKMIIAEMCIRDSPYLPLRYLPLYTSYVFSLPEPPLCLSTKNICLSTAMLLIINDFVSLFNQKTHTVYNNLL